MFYEFYLAAVKLLELTSPPVIQPQTPYIFNSSQVADMLNLWPDWDSFESWFTIFSRPSEFWLYDLWLQTQGIANHTVSSHYIQEPILCFYHADGWQNVVSRPGLNFYTVANIKRVLWEDPEFAKLIAKKGLKFLNTGS
jgi:hypothetical protein